MFSRGRYPVSPLFSDSGVSLKDGARASPSKSATTMCNRSEMESPLVLSLGNVEAGLGISHQFIVSPATPLHLIPSVTRHIFGRTARDAEVDQLPVPPTPWAVCLAVMVLRWYRKMRPAPSANVACGIRAVPDTQNLQFDNAECFAGRLRR